MPQDKYSAVWLSYSSISDFLTCPRAYFLKNVYKQPQTGRKIALMSPPLALGQAVHEVVESLSKLPVDHRFDVPLVEKLEYAWKKISGKRGGFSDNAQEERYKDRGKAMLARATAHPGPLAEKAVKLPMDLPQFWLSEQDNIILCGKIDWLRYDEPNDSVQIIDFKTSKGEESPASLQLPIYHLLAHYCQKRPITGVSYWYLERNDEPTPMKLPELEESQAIVTKIAKQVKLARSLERFLCPQGPDGCSACQPYERVVRGEAEFVGSDENRRDVYILPWVSSGISSGGDDREDGIIL
ncbi:MAG TPA: PD-(D/E)XK nuclease family protein [Patescibacteria group bacterium]|nr:PD-(D/E)XK nuclease family protein [Patescibacteria group bacterium]